MKNLYYTYEYVYYQPEIEHNLMDEQIKADHGVTQGRHSSCKIFSFYISDMKGSLDIPYTMDFTHPNNLLQLADDALVMSENTESLILLFEKIFSYCKTKFITVNMDKTRFLQLSNDPYKESIAVGDRSISAVDPKDGYNWLGFNLSYASNVKGLIRFNFMKKKANIGKLYAWLQVNGNTPFLLKMKILYNCMFTSLLYSCEAWGNIDYLRNESLLIERNALKAILGIKKGTPEDIISVEINKNDIITSIYNRQLKFYQKFNQLNNDDSSARCILQKYKDLPTPKKPYLDYYENLLNHHLPSNIQMRKERIHSSISTMHTRYRDLFHLHYNDVLYNSMINDQHRMTITRWRLSSHRLFIETGRYKIPHLPRDQRICSICLVIEDEEHSLLYCRAHVTIKRNHRNLLQEYSSVENLLNPKKSEDISRIAKYINNIENNMEHLKMIK